MAKPPAAAVASSELVVAPFEAGLDRGAPKGDSGEFCGPAVASVAVRSGRPADRGGVRRRRVPRRSAVVPGGLRGVHDAGAVRREPVADPVARPRRARSPRRRALRHRPSRRGDRRPPLPGGRRPPRPARHRRRREPQRLHLRPHTRRRPHVGDPGPAGTARRAGTRRRHQPRGRACEELGLRGDDGRRRHPHDAVPRLPVRPGEQPG